MSLLHKKNNFSSADEEKEKEQGKHQRILRGKQHFFTLDFPLIN